MKRRLLRILSVLLVASLILMFIGGIEASVRAKQAATDSDQPTGEMVTTYYIIFVTGCDLPNMEAVGTAVLYSQDESVVYHPQPGATHAYLFDYWIFTRADGSGFNEFFRKYPGTRLDTTRPCSISSRPETHYFKVIGTDQAEKVK